MSFSSLRLPPFFVLRMFCFMLLTPYEHIIISIIHMLYLLTFWNVYFVFSVPLNMGRKIILTHNFRVFSDASHSPSMRHLIGCELRFIVFARCLWVQQHTSLSASSLLLCNLVVTKVPLPSFASDTHAFQCFWLGKFAGPFAAVLPTAVPLFPVLPVAYLWRTWVSCLNTLKS